MLFTTIRFDIRLDLCQSLEEKWGFTTLESKGNAQTAMVNMPNRTAGTSKELFLGTNDD